jgi:hypothetical protein
MRTLHVLDTRKCTNAISQPLSDGDLENATWMAWQDGLHNSITMGLQNTMHNKTIPSRLSSPDTLRISGDLIRLDIDANH